MPKDITPFQFNIKFSMDVSSVLWVHVFSYLDEKDQASVSGVCYEWWKMIFGKLSVLREVEWQELDISGTGRLYRFIPLKMFSTLERLNMSETMIANAHFRQMVQVARNLQSVNIANCPSLDQSCIFQVKEDFGQLRHIDISRNAKFTILTVACLCSCENLEILVAHGYEFSAEELLFLEKTFESISSGTLELETNDGYNALDVMATFPEELFGDELLF